MKKAFLCHSTVDKSYVELVASKLGRAQVIVDSISFTPGIDFRSEIRKHLDAAAIFIFFASKKSIDSSWCKFELDHAEIRRMTGGIEAQLTIIVDPTVTHEDLPKWMQFTKAVSQPRASQATRLIQGALYSLQPDSFRPPFIGRSDQFKEFVHSFSTRQPAPRILILSGLEGVGRRTYLERSCKDNLGLDLGPFFLFDETKRLEDIYLWLFNETGDLATRVEIRQELEAFVTLSMEEQAREIVSRLQLLCRDNAVPCIVDYGGLLTDPGQINPGVLQILEQFLAMESDSYLAFVSRRIPRVRELAFKELLFEQGIPPLNDAETKLLLQRLLKRYKFTCFDSTARRVSRIPCRLSPGSLFGGSPREDLWAQCFSRRQNLIGGLPGESLYRPDQ